MQPRGREFLVSDQCPLFDFTPLSCRGNDPGEGWAAQGTHDRSQGVPPQSRLRQQHGFLVRIAAGEVRKRLAQYYGDPRNSGQIQIELPVGSYVPEFRFPQEGDPEPRLFKTELSIHALENRLAPVEPASGENREPKSDLVFKIRIPNKERKWVSVIVLLLVAWAGAWLAVRLTRPVSGFDAFWAPLLSTQRVTLISIGDVLISHAEFVPNGQRSPIAIPWNLGDKGYKWDEVGFPSFRNSLAAARVAAILGKHNKSFDISTQSRTTFDDLSRRPVIEIGSFDNDWTMRDTNSMRFRFQIDMKREVRSIADLEPLGAVWGFALCNSHAAYVRGLLNRGPQRRSFDRPTCPRPRRHHIPGHHRSRQFRRRFQLSRRFRPQGPKRLGKEECRIRPGYQHRRRCGRTLECRHILPLVIERKPEALSRSSSVPLSLKIETDLFPNTRQTRLHCPCTFLSKD